MSQLWCIRVSWSVAKPDGKLLRFSKTVQPSLSGTLTFALRICQVVMIRNNEKDAVRMTKTDVFMVWRRCYKLHDCVGGIDVTIFCDFWQFSAKELAVFSEANVMVAFFAKTSSRLKFCQWFWRKCFKIITSVRGGIKMTLIFKYLCTC
jgi:hypothetical protein